MALYLGDTKVSPTIEKEYLGIPLELSATGVLQKSTTPFTWKSQGSSVGDYGLDSAFINCTGLTGVDLSSLTQINNYSLHSAFSGCTNLITADLSGLTTIYGTSNLSGGHALENAFYNCSSLSNVRFDNLTIINGSFNPCTSAFYGCTNLTTVSFPSLNSISSQAFILTFQKCTSLQALSFPALTSTSFGGSNTKHFDRMLSGVTGCTVHFPSNLQSVIGSWSDVTAGFGGTNTTVLFDLPATT